MANKKQWDYLGNFREGNNPIQSLNPLFAKYACPHTEQIKKILIQE